MMGAAPGYGRTYSGVTFFSKKLCTYAIDDVVKPTDCAVRREGSFFPPHKIDGVLKASSLKAFLENGQIPDY
jgi:hypothetical protein